VLSCTLDVPLDVRDADFLRGLLVVLIPLAVCEIDARELGTRLCAHCFPLTLEKLSILSRCESTDHGTHISFELDEFQPSTVHGNDVHRLRRILLCVCFGRFEYIGCVLSLDERISS